MSVVDIARKYMNSPYLFGANGSRPKERMDCSRFVQNVMREMGVSISRSTHTQKNEGQAVNFNDMIPGDCIYYDGHVVMYIGNGRIIHASGSAGKVTEGNVYGRDKIITIRRFLQGGGINEFVFDPGFYSNKYSDIRNAFGNNYSAMMNHYLTYGIKEGRQGSIIFDVNYYKNNYPDLQNAFGGDNSKYVNHFIQYGINEGRRASNEFDPLFYKNKYSDLRNEFGNNWKSYYKHYLQFGRKEGRQAHC